GGFKTNTKPCFFELGGQRLEIVYQGFSACNDDRAGRMLRRVFNNGVHGGGWMLPGIPAFLDVAPVAANVASAQSDEVCRLPGIESVSLNGIKLFHRRQDNSFLADNRCCSVLFQFPRRLIPDRKYTVFW